jgi:hypothetical protein
MYIHTYIVYSIEHRSGKSEIFPHKFLKQTLSNIFSLDTHPRQKKNRPKLRHRKSIRRYHTAQRPQKQEDHSKKTQDKKWVAEVNMNVSVGSRR